MTTRSEKLSRLTIGSPCQAPWDEMEGDLRQRHCRECDRQVHDFSHRTPREIAALVHGRWRLQRAQDQPSGLLTLLLRKSAQGWRISFDHTSSK